MAYAPSREKVRVLGLSQSRLKPLTTCRLITGHATRLSCDEQSPLAVHRYIGEDRNRSTVDDFAAASTTAGERSEPCLHRSFARGTSVAARRLPPLNAAHLVLIPIDPVRHWYGAIGPAKTDQTHATWRMQAQDCCLKPPGR